MNLFIKIIFVLTSFGFTYSQDCKSKLIIETDLQLVNIFINDSLVSDSSFYETELNDGNYKIIVMENSDRWDAKTFIDSIEIKNCETKKLSISVIVKFIWIQIHKMHLYLFKTH